MISESSSSTSHRRRVSSLVSPCGKRCSRFFVFHKRDNYFFPWSDFPPTRGAKKYHLVKIFARQNTRGPKFFGKPAFRKLLGYFPPREICSDLFSPGPNEENLFFQQRGSCNVSCNPHFLGDPACSRKKTFCPKDWSNSI